MVEGQAYRGRLLLAHAVLIGFIALVMVPMVMVIPFRSARATSPPAESGPRAKPSAWSTGAWCSACR